MEKMTLPQTVLALVGGALAVTFLLGYLPTDIAWLVPLSAAALYLTGAHKLR